MSDLKQSSQPVPVEAVFDEIGGAYDVAFAGLKPQEKSIDWLLAQLKEAKILDARIVDIGCGTGRPVCEALAHAGHRVLGIDISIKMIEVAQKVVTAKEPGAHFLQMDQRAFLAQAVKDGPTWDAVVSYFSMISTVTQQEVRDFVRDIYQIVKPGGFFVFATLTIDADGKESRWMGFPLTISGLSSEKMVDHIKSVGFEVVHQEVSKFKPNAVEAGIHEDDEEETHLFVHARKGA
jgi:2-polyprenyl-3-methyl-5-hydroxy-6-metoxy-1,4-benzoquinol methylase